MNIQEYKICNYCGKKYYRKDFIKVFHRMVTCGSLKCKNKLKRDWTYSKTCIVCKKPITKNSKLNKCRSCGTKGKGNPFYGKTHDEETKKKIKLFKKGCIPWIKGKHHSKESNIKNSIAHQKGENIYIKGGLSVIINAIRHSLKYQEWRQRIFIRDNFTCQKCGQLGGQLEAHHKKPFSKMVIEAINYMPLLDLYDAIILYSPLWDIKKGITLCKKCHYKKKKGFIKYKEYQNYGREYQKKS